MIQAHDLRKRLAVADGGPHPLNPRNRPVEASCATVRCYRYCSACGVAGPDRRPAGVGGLLSRRVHVVAVQGVPALHRLGQETLAERQGVAPVPALQGQRRPVAGRKASSQLDQVAAAMTPPGRAHPPDRRAPTHVPRGHCPLGRTCRCAPDGATIRPDQDRMCKLPYPSQIPPCPEREFLDQRGSAERPRVRCCIECGRITARVWVGDELPWAKGVPLPWCGGSLPTVPRS